MPEAVSATDINFTVKKAGIYEISFIYAQDPQKQKEEERRLQEEYDTQVIRTCNELLEMGREIEREEIRKNIRREFKGFTFDNEPPVGLRPEPLALPEPRRARYAKYLG